MPSALQLDDEVVEQRSATSRTFAQDDGSLVTRVFSLPVNFREDGKWRKIDTTLVDADEAGYVHQRANDGDVLIPRDLSRPLRVSYDDAWLSFALRGAEDAAPARIEDDTAHFDDAADGVDASYQATNVGVKETLTLADASAQRQLVYDIAASDGLTAHEFDRGVVEFRNADGHAVFRFTAPVAWDQATAPAADGRVSSQLEQTATGWTLRLTVDADWLSSPDRQFPVKVDPIVQWQPGGIMRYSGALQDCTVASGDLASTSLCTEPTLKVGADATHTYTSLLSFNTPSAIEQDSVIAFATLLMHAGGTGTAPTSNLRVRPITQSWTPAATWNTRDGSAAWSTPGGTVSTAAADIGPATAVGQLDSWYQWRVPADIVQRWVWGTQPDFGVQLSADAGSPQTVYSFDATEFDPYKRPAIDIYWRQYGGDVPSYTQDVQRLSDTSQIAVNVANGQLKYTSQDASLPGPSGDLPITVDRQWSSHQAFDDQAYWHGHAYGWSHTYAQTYVGTNPDGSVYYSDPTGGRHRFAPDGNGGYATPTGLDASLCKIQTSGSCTNDGVSGATYRLTIPSSGVKYYYLGSNRLGAIKDGAGHAVTLDYSTANTVRITGSDNRLVSFGLNANGNATSMLAGTDSWLYGLDSNSQLTSATLPSRGTTTYEYNNDRQLTKVTEPGGKQTRFEWGWTSRGASVVKKVTRVLDTSDPTNPTKNPTVTYAYDFPNHKTTVTDAAGNATATPTDDGQTTYRYDERLNVTSASLGSSSLPDAPQWSNPDALWDTSRPTAAPGGALYDARDGYVDGQGQTAVTLGGTDSGSGVRRAAIEEVGGGEIGSARTSCAASLRAPRTCPSSASLSVNLDEAPLAEGAHHFREVAQDLAGNAAHSSTWTVNVDRTGPSAPTAPAAYYDADSDYIDIEWADSQDPMLPGGVSGSGVSFYRYRYEVDSAGFGSWERSDDAGFSISEGRVGASVHVEVEAVDAVGNGSARLNATVAASATAQASDEPYFYEIDGSTSSGTEGPDDDYDPTPTTTYCTPDADVGDDCSDPDAVSSSDQQVLDEPSLASQLSSFGGVSLASLAAGSPYWGLSTQLATQIDNPDMKHLHVQQVRIVVPWDVALRPFAKTACGARGDVGGNYKNLKDWVAAARANGQDMLVSFGRCAGTTNPPPGTANPAYRVLPSLRQYKRAVLRFLKNRNFQGIHLFTAWNEPNSGGQPTSDAKHPNTGAEMAAHYWSSFAALCRSSTFSCSVAAGEFVDGNDYTGRYFRRYKAALTRQPTVWAFHPYVAANSTAASAFKRFDGFISGTARTDAPSPHIWITEAGGIVNSLAFPNRTETQAAAAADRLLSDVVNRSSRISRLYYYAAWGDPPPRFDSGLLRYADLTRRPSYDAFLAKTNPSGTP